MPIYEFVCNKCKEEQERLMQFSDRTPRKCHCGGRLKKKIPFTTFLLKGKGWTPGPERHFPTEKECNNR